MMFRLCRHAFSTPRQLPPKYFAFRTFETLETPTAAARRLLGFLAAHYQVKRRPSVCRAEAFTVEDIAAEAYPVALLQQ